MYAYEAYLTNGFEDCIISNAENKTFLPASKENPDRFEESFNGVPLLATKIALRNKRIGEIGLRTWEACITLVIANGPEAGRCLLRKAGVR